MKFIRNNFLGIGLVIVIIIAYFVTRLISILNVPIFTDEAIYIRWSQIAYNDAAWRFISLTDGKQPSFVWANIITLRFFEDPLLAGRMVSVFAGFIALIGVFALSYLVFKNKKIALFSSFLYLIYPFALVYDRLALYETLIAAFFVWALFFQILLVRKMRLDVAMILGFVLGGAVLTKSSGFIAIYLMPFLFLLLDYKKKILKSNFLKLSLFLFIAIVMANLIYSIQRLSPFFYIIEEKNSIFVYPVLEWLNFSLETKLVNLSNNLKGLLDWFGIYFSIPFILAVVLSFVYKSKYKEKLLLAVWFLAPFGILALFGKTLYPRYIFFMTLSLLPLVSYGFIKTITLLNSKIITVFLTIALVSYPLFANFYILTDFKNAPIPKIDLEQLINGWPAGGGVSESVEFFKSRAEENDIFIATQGTFGLMPFAYDISLSKVENVEIKGYWPVEDQIPAEVLEKAKTYETYFVFYQPCIRCAYPGAGPDAWPMEKISEFKKGRGDTTLSVYKVKSD